MPEPVPAGLSPMLAVAGDPPRFGEWSYEVKWDGHRALASVVAGAVTLTSRGRRDITAAVPALTGLGEALGGRDGLFDGELVAFGPDGRPDFGLLARRLGAPHVAGAQVTYLIFDVLHLDGRSCLQLPHRARRALLESLSLSGPGWGVPAALTGSVDEVLEAVRLQGLEGVLAKRSTSPYTPGRRSTDWVKLVNLHTLNVVVGGWQPGAGRRAATVGSLLLGVPEPDGLRYVGHVGTGFTDTALADLGTALAPLHTPRSPFAGPVPPHRARTAQWVRPAVRGEVQFAAWTADGLLRQARWRGVRGD